MNSTIRYFSKIRYSVVYTALLALIVSPIMSLPNISHAQTLEEVVVTAQKREETLQEAPISLTVFGTTQLDNLGATKLGDISEYVPNLSLRQQPSSQDNYGFGLRGITSGETSIIVEPTVGVYVDGVYYGITVGAAFDVNDIERLEVLRGPQGTLYGRNTIGGALNVVTRRPDGDFSFKQKVGTGSRGSLVSRTVLNSTTYDLGFGEFAFSAAYYYEDLDDGYVLNTADNSRLGDFESKSARFSARLSVGEVYFDYNYNQSDRNTRPNFDQLSFVRPGHVALAGPLFAWAASAASADRVGSVSKYFNQADNSDQYSDIMSHDLTISFATAWGEFKSITGYREWDGGGNNTSDFGSQNFTDPTDYQRIFTLGPGGTLVRQSAPITVSLFEADRTSDLEQYSQEFQLVGSAFDEKLDYVVGLYYFNSKVNELNPQSFVLAAPFGALSVAGGFVANDPRLDPTADPLVTNKVADLLCAGTYNAQTADVSAAVLTPPAQGSLPARCIGSELVLNNPLQYGQDQESQAVYGQFTYRLSNEFSITVGGRYTEDEKDAYLYQRTAQGRAPVNASNDWSKFTWDIKGDYQVTDDLSTYLGVSQGYRAGGFNARASNERSWTTPYNEEEVTSYEFGWKWQDPSNRLRINGAVFFQDYQDRQLAQFEAGSGGASSFISNAGEQENYGFEVDAAFAISEAWTLRYNLGYLDAEFVSFLTSESDPITGFPVRDANGAAVERDLSNDSGIAVPHAPDLTSSFQLEYNHGDIGIGNLSAWLGVSYSDDVVYHAQLNRFDSTDNYTLVDFRISLTEIGLGEGAGNLSVALWGKNITNEEVREWGIDFGALGFAVNTYKELASWGFEVTYDF